MEVFFQIVTDAEGLRKACAELDGEMPLGFDTETTELDPYRGDLRLVQLSTGASTYVIDLLPFRNNGEVRNNPEVEPLRELLRSEKQAKIAHNAKFDTKWVMHHLGCEVGGVFDTMLASQLIAAGDRDRRHSLADAAQYFLGVELDKTQQVSDWSQAELSHSQVEYAAKDAVIMLQLYEAMHKRIEQEDLKRVSQLEFECVVPISKMELNGIYLDIDLWREQLSIMTKQQEQAADLLQEMLAAGVAQASLFGRPEINLDSTQQISEAMRNVGVPMPDSTRAWELEPLKEKYPQVAALLNYREAHKAISSFGENILEFIEPKTGRIHADFRQIGAPTGRFSCSNPNLQQIPHTAQYRRCFRAPTGRKLVIADYSQIELRILAEFSGDKNFISAFESGSDFHAMTAAQVFGVSADQVTEEQRSFAKRLNFGIVYGVGASRFGMMTGMSKSDAENTMRRYFATYRDLDAYLRNSAENVIKDREAKTASGRRMRLFFDETDREKTSAARRNGVNMPIQGTSADILKRALRKLHDGLAGTNAKLVNIVHDEIIIECDADEASEFAQKLTTAMTDAGRDFLTKVSVSADVRIADNWTK